MMNIGNDISRFDGLLYKRQFVLSKYPPIRNGEWSCTPFGDYAIYTHPDDKSIVLNPQYGGFQVGMVGYMIDPYSTQSDDEDILLEIAEQADIAGVIAVLKKLSGRFVLFVRDGRKVLVFHDPCGLKSVYYTACDETIFVGSSPSILSEFTEIESSDNFSHYFATKYYRSDRENWLPSGMSLFKHVMHLVPNHYLDTEKVSQQRYYPDRMLIVDGGEDVATMSAELLRELMKAAKRRYSLAIPVTSGWDSRLLVCASRSFASEVFYYTLRYRGMDSNSPDIKVPAQMLSSLGLDHHVIDCHGDAPGDFVKFYEKNAAVSHYEDWGKMAYAMMFNYPKERVCIKGNASEIIKCHYYKKNLSRKVMGHDDILKIVYKWKGLNYAEDAIEKWYLTAAPVARDFNFHILDLLYWEQRMGSWQAQSQLEWGFLQETFTPFNHRPLLEKLMSSHASCRLPPECSVFWGMCTYLWEDTMGFPVNPLSRKERVSSRTKKFLNKIGLYETMRSFWKLVS